MKIFFVYDAVDNVDFPIGMQIDEHNILRVGPKHGSTSIWQMWERESGPKDDATVDGYKTDISHSHWVWRDTHEALESAHNEVLRKFLDKKLGFKHNKVMPTVDRFDYVHDYLNWCWGINSNQPNDYHCRMDYRIAMLNHFKPGDKVVKLKDLTLWLQVNVGKSMHRYKNDYYNHPIAFELSFEYYKERIIKKHEHWFNQQLAVDNLVRKYYEDQ